MIKKWVELEFEVGQHVYLKTDEDQKLRIIKSIWLQKSGVQYQLASGTSEAWHFDFEISIHQDVKLKTSDK